MLLDEDPAIRFFVDATGFALTEDRLLGPERRVRTAHGWKRPLSSSKKRSGPRFTGASASGAIRLETAASDRTKEGLTAPAGPVAVWGDSG